MQLIGVLLEMIFSQKISEPSGLAQVNGHEFVILEFEALLSELQELLDEQFVEGFSAVLLHVIVKDDLQEEKGLVEKSNCPKL